MTAQTVISHALTQGAGVSLVKGTDASPLRPRRLYLPEGAHGDNPIVVNLSKGHTLCDGCVAGGADTLALYRSTDRGGYVTLMCNAHAHRWGVMR